MKQPSIKKTTRHPRTDGEITRLRILKTAGKLFAANGFANTPNKLIATHAAVDLASINYHFGSRNGLYEAVLTEAHRNLIDMTDLQNLAYSTLPATEKLKTVVVWMVQSATRPSTPWHIAVLTAELLAPSPHIQHFFQSEVAQKASFVSSLLSDITGIPHGEAALQRCLISVIAPCLWLQIGKRGIRGPVQALLHMPPDILAEHLYQFALAGLRAIGEEYRGKSVDSPKGLRENQNKNQEIPNDCG